MPGFRDKGVGAGADDAEIILLIAFIFSCADLMALFFISTSGCLSTGLPPLEIFMALAAANFC